MAEAKAGGAALTKLQSMLVVGFNTEVVPMVVLLTPVVTMLEEVVVPTQVELWLK